MLCPMERPCTIHFPTETGIEIWEATADDVSDYIVQDEIPYMDTTTWINTRTRVTPYSIRLISCEGRGETKLEEWIMNSLEYMVGRAYGIGWKKNIRVAFLNIEYIFFL